MKFAHAVLILSIFGAFTAHADQPGNKVACTMDKSSNLTDMSQLDAKTTVSNSLNTNGTAQPAPIAAPQGSSTAN